MKKPVFTFALLLIMCSSHLMAQEEKSYGPVAGNYAVGISSNPIWEYFGNFFGKTEKNYAPSAFLAGGSGIFGKYYTADNRAIRAGANLYTQTATYKTPFSRYEKRSENTLNMSFSLGLENRIGEGRFQAFYGPSAGIGLYTGSTSYDYDGNQMYGDILKEKNGTQFSLAAGLFGGAEYFLLPKIALGTELGFGIQFLTRGTGNVERHEMDDVAYRHGGNELSLGFQSTPAQMAPRGSIYITFYF